MVCELIDYDNHTESWCTGKFEEKCADEEER